MITSKTVLVASDKKQLQEWLKASRSKNTDTITENIKKK